MRVDTLGFLSPQGSPPEVDPSLADHIDLMHVTAAPPTLSSSDEVLGCVEGFVHYVDGQEQLHVVERADDINATTEGSVGVVLGLQESPHDADRHNLSRIFNAGIRVITLSYRDGSHPFGGGFTEPEARLTDLGRNFLYDCEETQRIVDLSHVGRATAHDVLDFRRDENLTFPVFASHGGVYELFDGEREHTNNKRNLPWEVLEGIVEAEGIVGIYALTFGLSESRNDIGPMIDHLAGAIDRLGSTAVARGTDAGYWRRDEEAWQSTIAMMTGLLASDGQLQPRYPDYPHELNCVDKIGAIAVRLRSMGMLQNEINAVAGDNASAFFRRALP